MKQLFHYYETDFTKDVFLSLIRNRFCSVCVFCCIYLSRETMCFYTEWLFLVVCDSYFVALFQNKLFFIVKVYINACNLLGTRYICK